jgi:hypothetical protein
MKQAFCGPFHGNLRFGPLFSGNKENLMLNQLGAPSANGLAAYAKSATPQTIDTLGVQSALKEIDAQVAESLNLGGNLRGSVGISRPESPLAPPTAETLAMTISNLASRLRSANDDLADVLRHLST